MLGMENQSLFKRFSKNFDLNYLFLIFLKQSRAYFLVTR